MKYLKINSKPFHVVQYVDKVVNTIVALNHAGCKHRSCDLSKTLNIMEVHGFTTIVSNS